MKAYLIVIRINLCAVRPRPEARDWPIHNIIIPPCRRTGLSSPSAMGDKTPVIGRVGRSPDKGERPETPKRQPVYRKHDDRDRLSFSRAHMLRPLPGLRHRSGRIETTAEISVRTAQRNINSRASDLYRIRSKGPVVKNNWRVIPRWPSRCCAHILYGNSCDARPENAAQRR